MGPRTEQVKKQALVVMVAEKPSIALSITEALSNGKYSKGSGLARSLPVYVFNGLFKGHHATFKVTSVAGHVFNRDFPTEYQDWKQDPEGLFDAPTLRKLDKHSRPVANHLSNISRNLDFLVLWLDCDKEGENICFEVLDVCKRNIPNVRYIFVLIYFSRNCKEFTARSLVQSRKKISKQHSPPLKPSLISTSRYQ
jgi:DNA topoisomerase-3